MTATAARNGVQSVASALDVLDCFSWSAELGVTEVATRLGVSKSTAHRLLSTLTAKRLVERIPATGRYRLGLPRRAFRITWKLPTKGSPT